MANFCEIEPWDLRIRFEWCPENEKKKKLISPEILRHLSLQSN